MSVSTSFADMVKKGKNFTILGDYTMGGIKRNKMNKHSKGNIHLKICCIMSNQLRIEQNLMELLFMWELIICQRKRKYLPILLIQLYQFVNSIETQV